MIVALMKFALMQAVLKYLLLSRERERQEINDCPQNCCHVVLYVLFNLLFALTLFGSGASICLCSALAVGVVLSWACGQQRATHNYCESDLFSYSILRRKYLQKECANCLIIIGSTMELEFVPSNRSAPKLVLASFFFDECEQ